MLSAMIPSGYSETVAVAEVPCHTEVLTVSYCDQLSENRCRESVTIGPGLAPVGYRSSVICYKNCTKKKFINRVEYQTRMKPQRYSETNYMRPRELVKSFASFLDYQTDSTRKWFKTSMEWSSRKTFRSDLSHDIGQVQNGVVTNNEQNGEYNREIVTSSRIITSSNGYTTDNAREINNNYTESQNEASYRSGPFIYNVRPRAEEDLNANGLGEHEQHHNNHPIMNGYADELDNINAYHINGY